MKVPILLFVAGALAPLFLCPARAHPPPEVARWVPLVREVRCEWKVPVPLVLAVIEEESRGDPRAIRREPAYWRRYLASNPGWRRLVAARGWKVHDVSASYGLMQVLFPTAWGCCGYRGAPAGLFDPQVNVTAGVRYLAGLLKRYDGDERLALAHFNGGGRGVRDVRAGRNTRPVRYARRVLKKRDAWNAYLDREEVVAPHGDDGSATGT